MDLHHVNEYPWLTIPSRSVNTTTVLVLVLVLVLFDDVFDSPVDSQVNDEDIFLSIPVPYQCYNFKKNSVMGIQKREKIFEKRVRRINIFALMQITSRIVLVEGFKQIQLSYPNFLIIASYITNRYKCRWSMRFWYRTRKKNMCGILW